jgi:hypothetical protein
VQTFFIYRTSCDLCGIRHLTQKTASPDGRLAAPATLWRQHGSHRLSICVKHALVDADKKTSRSRFPPLVLIAESVSIDNLSQSRIASGRYISRRLTLHCPSVCHSTISYSKCRRVGALVPISSHHLFLDDGVSVLLHYPRRDDADERNTDKVDSERTP